MRPTARCVTLLLLAAFLTPVGVGASSPSGSAHDAPAAANPATGSTSAAMTVAAGPPAGDCCYSHTGCAAASCAAAGCSVSPVPSRDGLSPKLDPCAASRVAADSSLPTGPVTDLSSPPPRV